MVPVVGAAVPSTLTNMFVRVGSEITNMFVNDNGKEVVTLRIGVIVGSVREGRKGISVAEWVLRSATGRDVSYELIDLAELGLPHLTEPVPPMRGHYTGERTKAWSELVAGFDGFIIVTAEYNHGIPGVLKNALDHLYAEWSGKPVGFVGYGVVGGARAVDQLRVLAGVLGMADVQPDVQLQLWTPAFDAEGVAAEGPHVAALDSVFGAVENWARLLRPEAAAFEPASVGRTHVNG
jgi:NAD(P)H-dependent FMN reductase